MDCGWDDNTILVDVLTCEKFVVGSGNSFLVSYSVRGGRPVVTLPLNYLNGSDICTDLQAANKKSAIVGTGRNNTSAAPAVFRLPSSAALVGALLAAFVGLATL